MREDSSGDNNSKKLIMIATVAAAIMMVVTIWWASTLSGSLRIRTRRRWHRLRRLPEISGILTHTSRLLRSHQPREWWAALQPG